MRPRPVFVLACVVVLGGCAQYTNVTYPEDDASDDASTDGRTFPDVSPVPVDASVDVRFDAGREAVELLDEPVSPDTGAGDHLCAPCTTNAQCDPGGYCLHNNRTGEMICGGPCGGAGCRSGYACVMVTTSSGTVGQCVPESGSCAGAPPPTDSGVPSDTGIPIDVGPATLTPGTTTVMLGTRRVLVYVPTSFRAGGVGLVALHGNGDTAPNFLATMGLRATADAHGIALAIPYAIPGSGPMGVDWDAYTRPATSNPDIVLARAARTYLVSGGVDAHRVFLLGYSQGGYLAYHVAMAGSTEFGAVNVSAAGDPLPGAGLASTATRHIPVDLLIGSGDPGLTNAQRTRDDLRSRGFEVRYTELPGVGHCCPLTGHTEDVWGWLSARPLP